MSDVILTDKEREYLDCNVPMLSTGSAVARVTAGAFASLLQAAFMPGNSKADQGLMKTIREIRYTKYKKAVLRKMDGTLTDKDKKTLEKLNNKEFILDTDTFDADEYTKKVYEEYMRNHDR